MIINDVIDLLKEKKYKICCAESITGGLLASAIISVPDASNVIDMSIVTYSNDMKIKYLNVKENTIKEYGVVSEEVALEMAIGAKQLGNSNIGLSTSGIAGPTGETKTKPIGMVCFGIVINDNKYVFTKYFDNIGRNKVREESKNFIFEKLYEILNAGN